MSEQPKSKRRHTCANCGADMGEWDRRTCEQNDVCGSLECNRATRDWARAERDEEHERLDRDMGWDRWR
jgi:hypothetical protein